MQVVIDLQTDRTLRRSVQITEAKMQKLEDETGIYRLDDGRYRVRATAKNPHTGKMKQAQKTLEAGVTLEDARAMRESLKAKLRKPPEKAERRREAHTVADFAELWLKRKAKRQKASTIDKAVTVLEHHILPEIGEIPIDQLTRRDVSDWLRDVEEKRKPNGDLYATASVRGWWGVLRNLLRDAHAEGFLDSDLTVRQTPPATGVTDRQEKGTYSAAELMKLVECAQRVQAQRYAEIATLAFTGMRIGELYGLHWEDIDLDNRRIDLRRRAWKGEVDSPKTDNAYRTVYFPPRLVGVLEEHREEMMRDQRPGWEKGIVFPSTKGTYRYGSSLKKPLKRVSEHLGFDIAATPQVLRRTWNTLLLKAGVDRITIRSQMGHASETMTAHYAGVRHDQKQQAVDGALVTLFEESQVETPSTCDQAEGDSSETRMNT